MKKCICMLRRYSLFTAFWLLICDSGPDPAEVQKAKELCIDLLKNVREQYEEHKNKPREQRYGANTGYGGERGYGDRAPDRSNSYGGGGGGYGGGEGGG